MIFKCQCQTLSLTLPKSLQMFSDAILLSVVGKVRLPDFEFVINLGDWPLEKKKGKEALPIVSWYVLCISSHGRLTIGQLLCSYEDLIISPELDCHFHSLKNMCVNCICTSTAISCSNCCKLRQSCQ